MFDVELKLSQSNIFLTKGVPIATQKKMILFVKNFLVTETKYSAKDDKDEPK